MDSLSSSSSSSRRSRLALSVASVMYTNAVYFPNSRIYQGDTPAMINYSCVNHVYYAYANVAQDGTVFVSISAVVGILCSAAPTNKPTRLLMLRVL